jgi:HEAT repeat protein
MNSNRFSCSRRSLGPALAPILFCIFRLFFSSGLGWAQSPADRGWQLLETGLKEKSAERRVAAARALGLIVMSARAASLAEKTIDDPRREVRAAGATSLGTMEAKESIPSLKKALNDKEPLVALAAAQSLISLGDPIGYEIYYAVLTGERKAKGGLIDEQLQTMRDRKKMIKLGIEQGVAFIPFGGLGYGAYKALRNDDASALRAAAARVLAKDPDRDSANALVRAASDKSPLIRTAALEALAERNDPEVLDKIAPHISDEKASVSYTAAAAVIRLSSIPRSRSR